MRQGCAGKRCWALSGTNTPLRLFSQMLALTYPAAAPAVAFVLVSSAEYVHAVFESRMSVRVWCCVVGGMSPLGIDVVSSIVGCQLCLCVVWRPRDACVRPELVTAVVSQRMMAPEHSAAQCVDIHSARPPAGLLTAQ